jgi:hypothetical protein
VFGVAGGTACLPDLVIDHRHDRVIGDTAFTRTVVVENVTEPEPALLHELPRTFPFSWDGYQTAQVPAV